MQKQERRRVVVTGLGCVSPVGNSVNETWDAIVAGRSGIAPISKFDTTAMSTTFAGEVKNFHIEHFVSTKEARHMDAFIQYGVVAGMEAIKHSGLEVTDTNADRIGVMVGSGIGGLPLIEMTHTQLTKRGPRLISPFFIPSVIINMISGALAIKFGFRGPNMAIATACSTGLHCIGYAARMIEYGDVDIVVAGGSEATISPLGVAGFGAARALSTRNQDPQTASRPWDRDRDGFVLGEGAGVMVLEEYAHAKARNASIYAEVLGFGMSADAYHITSPIADGSGAGRSMEMAMKNARINRDQVDYINAHGTSTVMGDIAETIGIKRVFGGHAKQLVVNSTKSMTGHLLGGAGGLESVLSVLAIHHQISPPTINIFNQDPACDLDYCGNTARKMPIQFAMKNSFGFGGTNGTLIFSRV